MKAKSQKDFAVVIGIDYHDHPEMPELKGVRNDAKAFIAWLEQGHSEGNLDGKRIIRKLKSPAWSDVKRAFDELLTQLEENSGRRLYMFVSGHGFGESINETSIYTSDHTRRGPVAFNLIKTADLLRFSGCFREVVVFIDCCRRMKRFCAPGVPFELEPGDRTSTHFYFSACSLGESAVEKKFGSVWRGDFALHVLKALNGEVDEALDRKGQVTAFTLKNHVTAHQSSADRHPEYLPTDKDDLLRTLVLAKGFQQQRRRLRIVLSDPRTRNRVVRWQDLSAHSTGILPARARVLKSTARSTCCSS